MDDKLSAYTPCIHRNLKHNILLGAENAHIANFDLNVRLLNKDFMQEILETATYKIPKTMRSKSSLYSERLYIKKARQSSFFLPSFYNNTIPKKLDAHLFCCLQFNLVKRYMHARELLKILDDLEKPKLDNIDHLTKICLLVVKGNMEGTCSHIESGLKSPDMPKEMFLITLNEYSTVFTAMSKIKKGAVKLVAAWSIVKFNRNILRTQL